MSSEKLPSSRRSILVVIAVCIAVAAAWFARPLFHRTNPLLETPSLLLDAVQAKSLYYNGAALSWIAARRPELLTAADRDPRSERARAFAQAVQDARLFRRLDRQWHFDALLLIGDPSQYRTLLDHLAETKDWKLRYADHTGLIFRRDGGEAWKLADLQPVRAHFENGPKRDLAMFLAQTAVRLAGARENESASQLLDEATRIDPALPEAWSGMAVCEMNRGKYREALAHADRALDLDKHCLPALAAKTQLLFAMKQFSDAYDLSKQLIERLPDDPNLLFYHAKIAHEAHAYKSEIEALEKLIARAEADGRAVSGYQLYLAQAYTTTGDAPHAIDYFMRMLDDPDLPQDQRDFARDSISRIKKRTGL
jgi:tetratricopeptide (TPR) repeat protein